MPASPALVIEMDIKPFTAFHELVEQVAHFVVANNLYRKGNDFYGFSGSTIDKMNSMGPDWGDEGGPGAIEGGYAFLDKPGSKEGMVRLYVGNCNPKWGFCEKEGGGLEIDLA